MPRTPEQEARWQALEQQKPRAALAGRIGHAMDVGLVLPQKFVSGLATWPKAYAGLTGNNVYEPQRGDDSYRLSLPQWAADLARGTEDATELTGEMIGGLGPNAPLKILSTMYKSPINAIYGGMPIVNTVLGTNTERMKDYDRASYEYQQAQEQNTLARKLLASYSGVLGVNKKDQEQKAREFDSDVQKYTTRDKWYKKPLGAAAIGTATGAGLGYGVGSMITKDKVNRILLSLLGGVAGGVGGHAIGQTIQDAANTSGARGAAYMNAKMQTDRLREYMGTLNKTLEAGPPVKPQVK